MPKTPTALTVYHQWKSGHIKKGAPFLICSQCGTRLTKSEPGDWKAAFFGQCPEIAEPTRPAKRRHRTPSTSARA